MLKRSRRRKNRAQKTGPDRQKSLGSGLAEIGFRPLGRRILIASGRTTQPRLAHPAPRAVHYDRFAGRIVIESQNGSTFTVPARSLQGLVDVPEEIIAEVELIGGMRLAWKRLGVDHHIALLVTGMFGTSEFMRGQSA